MKFRILCIMVLLCSLEKNIAASDKDQRIDITKKEFDNKYYVSEDGLRHQFQDLAKIYEIVREVFDAHALLGAQIYPLSRPGSTPVCGLTMRSGFMLEVTDTKNFVRSFWGQAVIVDKTHSYLAGLSEYDKNLITRLGLKEVESNQKPNWLYSGKKYLVTSLDGKKVSEPLVGEVSLSGNFSKENRAKNYETLRTAFLSKKSTVSSAMSSSKDEYKSTQPGEQCEGEK